MRICKRSEPHEYLDFKAPSLVSSQVLVEAGARTSGTVGEHAGRFFIATEACGNLPHRVPLESRVRAV